MSGFISSYYRLSEWIMRLAYVNGLWIAFTLLGCGIFGFMPATIAMFAVVRKWVQGEEDIKIFPLFWRTYRQEFLKANGLGWMIGLIVYLLSIEFYILRSSEHYFYQVASYGVLVLFFFLLIIVLYFFPVYTHFNLKVVEYMKWPLIIGMIHPVLTVFLIIILSFLLYITYSTIPALLFFFGGSVAAYIMTWGIMQTFPKYEKIDEKTI